MKNDRDNVSQCAERLVYVGAFLEAIPSGACAVGPLRAGQIDQIDDAALLGLALGRVVDLVERDRDDRVGPRARGVHVGGGHRAIRRAFLNLLLDFFVAFDRYLLQVLRVKVALARMLPDRQSAYRILLAEQIIHLFIVNLKHAEGDFKFLRLSNPFSNNHKMNF